MLAAAGLPITGMVHVTGGGLPGNLPRALPDGLTARIETARWAPAPIFGLIGDQGRVAEGEMFRTFNMGIGFALIARPGAASQIIELAAGFGHESFVVGEVVPGDEVRIE